MVMLLTTVMNKWTGPFFMPSCIIEADSFHGALLEFMIVDTMAADPSRRIIQLPGPTNATGDNGGITCLPCGDDLAGDESIIVPHS
jgi:hypothetical protein